MEFLMNKLLKCFQVMEEVDTVILIPDNLHLETMEVIVVLKLLEMDIGQMSIFPHCKFKMDRGAFSTCVIQ